MLEGNYRQVLENIENICKKAGRKVDSLNLLAVSKFHPAESIVEIAKLGQLHFAESYLKEAKEKKLQVKLQLKEDLYNKIQWHSIGHIQTNKAKDALDNYAYIHALDSERLALSLHKVLERKLHNPEKELQFEPQKVLIEVNIAKEEQKAGILEEECPLLIEKILALETLKLEGFMCLPPLQEKEGDSRKYFKALYELRNKMESEFRLSFPQLSMGTSGDYKEAIYEGATFIRIGTDIFGERQYNK